MSGVNTMGMLIVAVAAGFYAHNYLPNANADKNESHFSFKLQQPTDVKPVAPGRELGCNLQGYAAAGESFVDYSLAYNLSAMIPGKTSGKVPAPDVELSYGRDSEGVSLRISEDGKSVNMLFENAVSNGETKDGSAQFTVVNDEINYLTAINVGQYYTGGSILVIDKKTLRAFYSRTGLVPMGMRIGGESFVIECH